MRSPSTSDSGMPSIHSVVSTRLEVRRQSTAGMRNPGSSLVFSAISDMAAASMRKSISRRTEWASVSTTSTGFSRREGACSRSIQRAAK